MTWKINRAAGAAEEVKTERKSEEWTKNSRARQRNKGDKDGVRKGREHSRRGEGVPDEGSKTGVELIITEQGCDRLGSMVEGYVCAGKAREKMKGRK